MASGPPLNDCITYLSAQSGLNLTFGTNFFASLLPDQPDQAVMIDEYPGDTDWTMSSQLPAIEEYHFQILARDVEENYNTNQQYMQQIYRACIQVVQTTINGTVYQWWEPIHTPAFSHRDEKRRIHHVFSFYAMRTPT